uniref:calcium-activated potassium channel subunit beta-4-like n=1 Tax=Ciona intestinalis TaxID=7719 RepID=UPI000180D221|nr:calcium-activated potassium channel subunit beta-4-like [Ciona intestinalis]|eukprot:XP_002122487.1 calcium-activated potassium channel subunit beta-4-like [Ciona intestinalis]
MVKHRFTRSELRVLQLGVAVIFVAILSFAVSANTLLIPSIRSRNFVPTICTVISSEIIRSPCLCQPGNDCPISSRLCSSNGQANYPCVQVMVRYKYNMEETPSRIEAPTVDLRSQTFLEQWLNDLNHSSIAQNKDSMENDLFATNSRRALLHTSDMDLRYSDQCSFHPHCTRDVTMMTREVSSYRRNIGIVGLNFPCFYDPKNPTDAVLYRIYDGWSIFHSTFWPGLLLLTGVMIILLVYCCLARLKKNFNQIDLSGAILHTQGSPAVSSGGSGSCQNKRQTCTKIGLGGKVHV